MLMYSIKEARMGLALALTLVEAPLKQVGTQASSPKGALQVNS